MRLLIPSNHRARPKLSWEERGCAVSGDDVNKALCCDSDTIGQRSLGMSKLASKPKVQRCPAKRRKLRMPLRHTSRGWKDVLRSLFDPAFFPCRKQAVRGLGPRKREQSVNGASGRVKREKTFCQIQEGFSSERQKGALPLQSFATCFLNPPFLGKPSHEAIISLP